MSNPHLHSSKIVFPMVSDLMVKQRTSVVFKIHLSALSNESLHVEISYTNNKMTCRVCSNLTIKTLIDINWQILLFPSKTHLRPMFHFYIPWKRKKTSWSFHGVCKPKISMKWVNVEHIHDIKLVFLFLKGFT